MDPPRQSDDRRAWLCQQVDRYERPLLAYACRMLAGDSEAAQDAVQETFLRLCRAAPTELDGRIAPWLFAVCRTRVIDMQRAAHHRPQSADRLPTAAAADASPGPESVAQSAEDASHLAALIDSLAPRQQELLRLRLQGGLSYREIAEVTGLAIGTVSSQLHDAVRRLRSVLVSDHPAPDPTTSHPS